MIEHILCDMDGVLADFFGAALQLFDLTEEQYWARFDSLDAVETRANPWEIWTVIGVTQSAFWERIASVPDFWFELSPYPWAPGLLLLLERFGRRGVQWTIATAPARDPRCPEQKVRWMQRHIRPTFSNYMMGGRKDLMASPHVLLVDDSPHNCQAFVARGGCALLFPHRANGFIVPDVMRWLEPTLATAVKNPASIRRMPVAPERIVDSAYAV